MKELASRIILVTTWQEYGRASNNLAGCSSYLVNGDSFNDKKTEERYRRQEECTSAMEVEETPKPNSKLRKTKFTYPTM